MIRPFGASILRPIPFFKAVPALYLTFAASARTGQYFRGPERNVDPGATSAATEKVHKPVR